MNTQLDKIVQKAAEKVSPKAVSLSQHFAHDARADGESEILRIKTIIRRAIADAVRESGAAGALAKAEAYCVGATETNPHRRISAALANLRALAGETDGKEKEDKR